MKLGGSMKNFSKIKKMITYNFKTLVSFEILYKLISTIVFIPLFLQIFNFIVNITGYSYLTLENVFAFLTQPLTVIMIFLLLLLMTFYTLIDISTVIIILDCSYQQKKVSVKEAFIIALKKAVKVFNRKNILIPFLVLFLIPFLHIGISSSFISTIKIPEFIMDYIIKNKVLSIIYGILVFVFGYILLRWLYTMHYFILEDSSFKEARKKSVKLNKRSCLKDFIIMLLTQLGITLIFLMLSFLGILLIILFYKLFGKISVLSNVSITIIWLSILIMFIIMMLLSTPISYACISALYYYHKEKSKEEIKHVKVNFKEIRKVNKKFNIFKAAIILLIVGSGSFLTYLVLNDKFHLMVDYERNVEVTAHRGASLYYPENTMSAFIGAKKLGADWVELDVQQTKDGKIIVMHDSNLKRTTGVKKHIWEVTYDEIKDLDAGSFFDKKYNNERIPLLEDVIKYAKENDLKLNIELKPSGKEKDFEKSVIDIINDYNYRDMCVITSQMYEVLENSKKYDKDIKTVYVMSLAYGDILSLDAADSFSIEASSVTKTLVNNIHKNNKEILVWTINDAENMNDIISLNVDNIITDNITLANEVITSKKPHNVLEKYIKFLNDILK